MTLADLETRLRAEADERLFATGGQIYVSVDGEVLLDLAVGVDALDRRVERDTLFAVYCCGKPVVALAVAALIADGELSLDDRVGDILAGPVPDGLAPVPLRCVLDHTAGLQGLDPLTYVTLPAASRADVLSVCVPPPGWPVGHKVGYSLVLGWHVLGLVIEAVQPLPTRDLARVRVLEPLGVAGDLFVAGMAPAAFEANQHRLGVNIYLEGRSSCPVLTERLRRFRCLDDPSGATTASVRALGRFYEGLLAILRGGDGCIPRPLLEEFTSAQSHYYGYGFMVRLADQGFGIACSDRAFGHSAYGGMTASFCDPDIGLVIACHFNGRIDDESTSTWLPLLVTQIYRAIS